MSSTINHRLLTPRTLTGRHPATGVIHRLTIRDTGKLIIERTDYMSPNIDGWRQTYPILTEEADKHIWLILTISQHPATWPD